MSSPARRRKRALVRAALASVVSVGVLVLVWHALGNAVEWDGIHLTPLPVLFAVAGALVFLASADSDFVTGQTIAVDGGATNN